MEKLFFWYIIFINIAGLVIMFIDKQKAKRGMRRVREIELWEFALLGGALGCTIAMYLFRHKTKHFQFKFGLPLLAIIQIILIVTVFNLFA